ncbi:hypothetical protein ACQPX6_21425 [Actinomycetospora sp. CA-101289]|uniref:hypothetical protein n=1 Tax=Actinomycetospora sp. CA-101289 TaxID=3239893 RepID=UPI003D968805
MLRTLPVAAESLGFVSAGQPEPLMRWDDQGGRRVLTEHQEKDDAGDFLWTCYLMPTLAERPEVLQVRVSARQQPVLTQFGPVAVDGLEVNVRVGKDGKLAQYWQAAAVRDAAGKQQRHDQHKPEGQAA